MEHLLISEFVNFFVLGNDDGLRSLFYVSSTHSPSIISAFVYQIIKFYPPLGNALGKLTAFIDNASSLPGLLLAPNLSAPRVIFVCLIF